MPPRIAPGIPLGVPPATATPATKNSSRIFQEVPPAIASIPEVSSRMDSRIPPRISPRVLPRIATGIFSITTPGIPLAIDLGKCPFKNSSGNCSDYSSRSFFGNCCRNFSMGSFGNCCTRWHLGKYPWVSEEYIKNWRNPSTCGKSMEEILENSQEILEKS